LPTEVLETEDEAVDSEQAYRIFGGLSSDYLNKKKRKRTGSVSRMVDEFTRYTESTPTTDNVDDIID
jgi:hypothetical protein